ncbi:MAG: succinate dehydrogenase, cytochrome b556 subunit [Pseudomonadota bacterium]
MADVNRGNRPLSPHLSVYRFYITMLASITNRIAGVALAGGGVLLVVWLMAAATSPSVFAFVDGLMTSILGDLVMVGMALALWWHFFGGLRHLYWDTGRGFDLNTANRLSLYSIIAAPVMTAFTILVVM